jgi:hypothetical protein
VRRIVDPSDIAISGSLGNPEGLPVLKFNPPPDWPEPPTAGWRPPLGWTPDPTWPEAPAGWRFWLHRNGRRSNGPIGAYGAVDAGRLELATADPALVLMHS